MKTLLLTCALLTILSCKGKLKSEIDEIVDSTCACKSKTGRELSECKNILEKQAENLDKRIKELSENEQNEMEEYVRLKMNQCD